jgi:hypothetical protein
MFDVSAHFLDGMPYLEAPEKKVSGRQANHPQKGHLAISTPSGLQEIPARLIFLPGSTECLQ